MRWMLVGCLSVALLACGDAAEEAGRGEPAPAAKGTGEFVWEATAEGDEEAAALFRRLAVRRVRAVYGPDMIRIELVGGLAPGVMIVDPAGPSAVRLDAKKREAERAGTLRDLGERPDVELRPTGAEETIAGRTAREFAVTDAPEVREGAEVRVWLATDLPLPVRRYRADFDLSRIESPVPVMLSGPRGAVLRAVVRRDELTVTWTATKVLPGAPDPALFEVPEGFEGPR